MPLLFAFFTVRILRCSSLLQVTNIFYSFFYQLPTFTFTMTAVICLRFVLIHGIRKGSGLFFSFPFCEPAAAKSLQSCLTLCDPIDGSPPGSPVRGILQARKTGVGCHFLLQCMKVKSESEVAQSCPTLRDPTDCSPQAAPSMGFSRQEYWSGVPLPSPFCEPVSPKSLNYIPSILGINVELPLSFIRFPYVYFFLLYWFIIFVW